MGPTFIVYFILILLKVTVHPHKKKENGSEAEFINYLRSELIKPASVFRHQHYKFCHPNIKKLDVWQIVGKTLEAYNHFFSCVVGHCFSVLYTCFLAGSLCNVSNM